MRKKIIIHCNANSQTGFGHLSRCINLARALNNLNLEVYFIGSYSEFAKKYINHYSMEYFNVETCTPNSNFESYFVDIDAIIVDSYVINQGFIDEISNKDYYSIFIDDFCKLDFSNVDLVINFTIGAKNLNYSNKNVCLGTEFFLFKPELLEIRKSNLARKEEKKNNLLIFFSKMNLDSSKYISLLSKIYLEFSRYFHNIYCIDDKISQLDNITFLKPTFQIENYYQIADFIICGGGLTKYEAAYCAIPNASIAINEEQHKETKSFASYNLTNDLGYFEDDINCISERIHKLMSELNNQINTFMGNTQKHFGNNSLYIVAHRILDLLNYE